jgi:hypothetical protein
VELVLELMDLVTQEVLPEHQPEPVVVVLEVLVVLLVVV